MGQRVQAHIVSAKMVQLQTRGPILAREVIFLARVESRVICTFRSENVYLIFVSVVFDCVYVFAF